MERETSFTHGSVTHVITVLACMLISAAITWWGIRVKNQERSLKPFRAFIAAGSILSWILTVAYGIRPEYFSWENALPLHFCNLANLIGAIAVLKSKRGAQALLYFWSLGLCLWAFLTPFLLVGPLHLWFWVFWIYHLFIPVSLLWILFIDRFRPAWRDLRFAILATIGFTLSLALINALTGWNYGFVGQGKPGQPSPIDHLGPYPLRILWMLGIGSALFFLLTLPWILIGRKPRSKS